MLPGSANDAASAKRAIGSIFVRIIAWTWTIVAGGGGLWLLCTAGPWKLTHGWFALCSGVSACPSVAWFFKRYVGVKVSGWAQFSLAFFFHIAGRVALILGL
jgi:hypothetical protein